MRGDREPLYDFLPPMMFLVDVVILVHAGELSKLQVSYRFSRHLIRNASIHAKVSFQLFPPRVWPNEMSSAFLIHSLSSPSTLTRNKVTKQV